MLYINSYDVCQLIHTHVNFKKHKPITFQDKVRPEFVLF